MTLRCLRCREESGTSLVCGACRKHLTPSEKKQFTAAWHEAIVARGYVPSLDKYRCHHCRNPFSRDRVCGDHFPHPKSVRPDLRYDTLNGVPTCAACNVSNATTRARPEKSLCSRCRRFLPVRDSLCLSCL